VLAVRIVDKFINIRTTGFIKNILYKYFDINIMLLLASKLQFLKMSNPIFKISIFLRLANYKVNNARVIKVYVLNNEKNLF